MPFLQNRRNLIIVAVVVIILPIVVGLSLSKHGPGKQTAQITPPLPDLTKGIYKCPSSKEFCEGGKDIIKDKTYAGFGGDVATGSAVLAAFDGKVTGLTITLPPQFNSEKLNIIYLDNKQSLGSNDPKEENIRATYYFKGEEINFNELDAKIGANLGTVGGRMLYYDTSLLFTITKGDLQTGEKIRLTAKDFL